MATSCDICGKGMVSGGHVTRRGLAKKKGGIGMHVVKVAKRTFCPNIQPARVIVNGTPKKVKVCTACIRSGRIEKA